MRVLAIGECMAELAPADLPGEYRLGFAGDTFNTAWYLARVAPQLQVSYLTVIGEDAISERLRAFMRQSGIDDRNVRTSADRTIGLYLISLDNGERSFSYWRGQSAARTLADDPAWLDDAMSSTDIVYFSGITLAILAPKPRAVLFSALRDARANGKIVVFDPNLRPKLWSSPDEMTAAIMQAAELSDIALPSFEDEAGWFGDATPQATTDRYARAGVVTVIVKNGPDPVLFAQATLRGEVAVDPVAQVVDTTAAGDSFNAGILAGHAAGMTLEQGIAAACALSGKVVQHKGALVEVSETAVSIPTRAKGTG